jgi:hypothetical protein
VFEDGRHDNLPEESLVNGVRFAKEFHVCEPDGDEGNADTASSDNEREVGRIGVGKDLVAGSRDDESSAGGLSKRTEKIGSHTGNISDVITDVIGNGTWVGNIIFFKILEGLTDEIGTDISSFSVDTSTDSTEESDGRTTETVSGNELKHSSGEDADSLFEFVVFSVVGSHAAKLILVGPGPGSSGEVVVDSPLFDLWWIWEVVIENLSSGERLLSNEVVASWLSPSVSGISSWSGLVIRVMAHVSSHGIFPGGGSFADSRSGTVGILFGSGPDGAERSF